MPDSWFDIGNDRAAAIRSKVEARLKREGDDGTRLRVSDAKEDDGWVYVVVDLVPSSGGRASEHARFMARVERELRAEGHDRVLLGGTDIRAQRDQPANGSMAA